MLPSAATYPDDATVQRLLRRYAPVSLRGYTSDLAAGDRRALAHLIDAARWIDRIYWKQRSEHGWQLKQQLAARADIPSDLERLIDLGFGPWDVFDDDRPFWGDAERPPGGNLYPTDLTRDEINAYLDRHPDRRAALLSPTTVVRRRSGELAAVPYHEVFRDELAGVAQALLEASRHATHDGFRRFLIARARDLQSGSLDDSEAQWVDVGDSPIDIAIGPYEVYDDGLMGVKTSYEATAMIRHEMTDRLAEYDRYAADLAPLLPGAVAPRHLRQRIVIGVYDVVYTAGSTNLGAKPVAAMLPNDERVRREHGSRLLLFRNVISAKVDPILKPIAERLLASADAALVSEDAFVMHTLLHEMAHALLAGPEAGDDGRLTPNQRLRERYSAIEECRADLVGLVFLSHLVSRGVFPPSMRAHAAATFVASSLRVLRFGRENDYGRASTITLSYLLAVGAIAIGPDDRLHVDVDRTLSAATDLAARVQAIAREGSHADAGALIEELGTLPPAIAAMLPRLDELPVDLAFEFDSSLSR